MIPWSTPEPVEEKGHVLLPNGDLIVWGRLNEFGISCEKFVGFTVQYASGLSLHGKAVEAWSNEANDGIVSAPNGAYVALLRPERGSPVSVFLR